MAKSLYRYKYEKLKNAGILSFEAREIARQYTMTQIRKLPYIRKMVATRRLYVSNLKSKGYGDREILDRIYALYDRKDWLKVGRPDVWDMIRSFRKKDIDSGDYKPVKRGGTHHPKGSGISKGNLEAQRKKRSHHKSKNFGSQYEEKQGR